MKKARLQAQFGVGAVLVGVVAIMAVLAFVWTPYDPVHAIPEHRLEGVSAQHWLGTDQYGRDMLSRIMDGARISLLVAVASVALSALIGVPLGIWAGMSRGWVDQVIMRSNDLLLAFPALLLAIVLSLIHI